MTAGIAIMNKSAVALAADSAVTVSGERKRKVYKTANKIFTLSKFQPVSIMLYGQSNFLSTPWETIIKMYREQLGEQSFQNLEEYKEDFLRYLSLNDFFNDVEIQKKYFNSTIRHLLVSILNNLKDKEEIGQNSENFIKRLSEYFDNITQSFQNEEKLNTFENFNLEDLNSFFNANTILSDFINEENYNQEVVEKFNHLVLSYIKSEILFELSGLVFSGFGSNDTFPNCFSIEIGELINNYLRYVDSTCDTISDDNDGSIIPFAQRNVVQTIINGINPDLLKGIKESFKDTLEGFFEELKGELNQDEKQRLEDSINIDEYVKIFKESINEIITGKYNSPIVDAVSSFSKEDLSEMAESLIYLTYLNKRMKQDEEDVGGPVDVAVISKGDGFIWIKRKQYFDPEINQHFIQNYLK